MCVRVREDGAILTTVCVEGSVCVCVCVGVRVCIVYMYNCVCACTYVSKYACGDVFSCDRRTCIHAQRYVWAAHVACVSTHQ